MIEVISTANIRRDGYIKLAVHGPAGAGKTFLCSTLPRPFIISAESGLISLADFDLPAIEVHDFTQFGEAFQYVQQHIAHIEWLCLDSASDIAEELLLTEKKKVNDPRKAYGEVLDKVTAAFRDFRALPVNVYMTFKQTRTQDALTQALLRYPSMPGAVLTSTVPYMFDELFALRVEQDAAGQPFRVLQTSRDAQYEAKDRSGRLELFEPCDLSYIATKIRGQ